MTSPLDIDIIKVFAVSGESSGGEAAAVIAIIDREGDRHDFRMTARQLRSMAAAMFSYSEKIIAVAELPEATTPGTALGPLIRASLN